MMDHLKAVAHSDAVAWLAVQFEALRPFVPTYSHLLVSAVLPIFAGSHASLSRPSSAAKRPKKRDAKGREIDADERHVMEGLSPRDAVVFPVMAGCTLTGLYFLIKWLQDPTLLNKILNWYFATFSVFAVSKLVSDGLDVLHSFLFPHEYADQGKLFHVDPDTMSASPVDGSSSMKRYSPLPGPLSRLPLPSAIKKLAWTLYVIPSRPFAIRALIRPVLDVNVKIGIHGIEGLVVGLATVVYFNFIDKPWFLTNLMGFGFAYSALQILSPTTFATGGLVLCALFFYDVYFVFFTPMMVTVAQTIEIPAKLLFPRPADPDDPTKRAMAMLGLGDVVLPGMMIGLALRFDLYMFYLKKQVPKLSGKDGATVGVVKAEYQPLGEGWGDRFWTSNLVSLLSAPLQARPATSFRSRNNFPKPYFYAAIAGYVIGMLATLAAMQISNHPQPALLYLVPGVLGSLIVTGAYRGEMQQMWQFSDNEDEDEATVTAKDRGKPNSQKKPQGSFFSPSAGEERMQRLSKRFSMNKADASEGSAESGGDDSEGQRTTNGTEDDEPRDHESVDRQKKSTKDRTWLLFSIVGPDTTMQGAVPNRTETAIMQNDGKNAEQPTNADP